MHAGSVFFDKAGMNFNHIPVAHKLWAIILGSMLTLLGLGSGLFYFLEQAGQDVATAIQVNEDRISTALRWKALSQLNVERAYVLSVSTDDELILHTQKLVEVSSGNVVARLCCTSRKADEITPAPDAAMPWHPRAPCSGARVA